MLNIVLFQPEISPNTANIIRTCYALGAKLHIIKPISFELLPKYIKRAAAGHLLSDIQHEVHENYKNFVQKYHDANIFYITRYGLNVYSDQDFKKSYDQASNIFLMFGRESTGIDKKILGANIDRCLRIPMYERNRSINLANTVAILGYEVMRQLDFIDLAKFEVQKSKEFLLQFKPVDRK